MWIGHLPTESGRWICWWRSWGEKGDPTLPLTRLGGEWGRGLELSLGREGDKDRVEIAREGEELNPWTFVGGFSLSHHCVD